MRIESSSKKGEGPYGPIAPPQARATKKFMPIGKKRHKGWKRI